MKMKPGKIEIQYIEKDRSVQYKYIVSTYRDWSIREKNRKRERN